jgi:tape measure domain-containing protein
MAGSRFSIEAMISMIDHVTGPMKNANRSVSMFSSQAKGHFFGLGSAAKSALGFLGVAGGAGLVYMGMKKIVGEAMNIESSVANFTTLLGGSSDKAKQLVDRLQVMGAATPFEFKDLTAMTQILLPSMKGNIDLVIKTLGMLGDTAGGNAQKLESITRGYNKAMMKGKVDMESLNMIAEAGVPIHQELAKSMGFGESQMTAYFKKISSGTVSTADLTKAFEVMTSKGGLFYQGMIRSSKTTAGLWSTFQDAISMTAGAIGTELLPTLKELMISMTTQATKILLWVQNNKEYIKNLIDDVKSVLSFIWDMRYAIITVTAAFVGYRIAVKSAAAATKGLLILEKVLGFMQAVQILGFTGAIKYYTIGTKAAVVATKAWSIAQGAFNAICAMNPIGLICLAIIIMIGLIVVAVKYWDDWGAALVLFMGPMGMILSFVMAFKNHWSSIVTSFENGGILAGLKAIGFMLLDVVLLPLQKIIEVLARITPGKFGRMLKGAAESINDFRQGGFVTGGTGQQPADNMAGGGFGGQSIFGQRGFASPMSNQLGGNRSTYGNLDINVNAPKGAATFGQGGTMPLGTKLNLGFQ